MGRDQSPTAGRKVEAGSPPGLSGQVATDLSTETVRQGLKRRVGSEEQIAISKGAAQPWRVAGAGRPLPSLRVSPRSSQMAIKRESGASGHSRLLGAVSTAAATGRKRAAVTGNSESEPRRPRSAVVAPVPPPSMTVVDIAVADIRVGQRRRQQSPEAISQLTISIAAEGLQTPIIVRVSREGEEGPFVLVAGHGRLSAFGQLGRATIPAVVMDPGANELVIEIVENLRRKELTALERAEHIEAYTRLVASRLSSQVGTKKRGRPKSEVSVAAAELGVSRSAAHRAISIAKITREAKTEAKAHGVADNESVLAKVASADPGRQVEVLEAAVDQQRNAGGKPPVRASEEDRRDDWIKAGIRWWAEGEPTWRSEFTQQVSIDDRTIAVGEAKVQSEPKPRVPAAKASVAKPVQGDSRQITFTSARIIGFAKERKGTFSLKELQARFRDKSTLEAVGKLLEDGVLQNGEPEGWLVAPQFLKQKSDLKSRGGRR